MTVSAFHLGIYEFGGCTLKLCLVKENLLQQGQLNAHISFQEIIRDFLCEYV